MAGYMNNYGYPQMNNQMSVPYYGYPNNMQSTIDRLEKLQNQQYQQQQQMNYPQQQQSQPQTNVNWVQVTNIQQAKEQIVQPNNTVWMMDSSLPRIYVKSVSPVGKIDFQPYQLVPLDENGNLPNQQMSIQQEQMTDGQGYVPVEEFNKLTQTVNDLKQTIIVLNQKIEMYEQLFQGQQTVAEAPKTSGRRGGSVNATESSK